MTSKRIAQTNQQQDSEKPQASSILQRAAVRSVSDAGVQSTDDLEAQPLGNSAFSKDFSRVPISTSLSPPALTTRNMINRTSEKRPKKNNESEDRNLTEGEITETPSAQVDEENIYSQFQMTWSKELGVEIPRFYLDLDLGKKNIESVELPPNHVVFKFIENQMNKTIKDNPYKAPKKEATRMHRAQEILTNTESSEEQVKMASRRLKEDEKGGASRVKSGEIEITRLEVIYNKDLLIKFQEGSRGIGEKLKESQDENPLRKVSFTSINPPVINRTLGQVLLEHGTDPETMEKIKQGGFRPELGRNKGTSEKPRYGPLGQGTYFSDNSSKVQTYRRDSKSLDPESSEDTPEFETMLAMVTLGHPKKMHGMAEPGGSRRSESHNDPLPAGRHSVYSRGLNTSKVKNLFSSASGTNEFVVKNSDQAYPTLRISYKLKEN